MSDGHHNLKLLPIIEVAEMLGVSKRTVDRMIAAGEFQIVKVLRSTRIPLSEIKAYIKRNTFNGGSAA